MEMLELNNLHKTFNPGTVNEKVALNGVSLHMEAGDFATIVGSNGAGKSTMFNAITGGFIADEGSIVLGGQDITFAPEYERSKVIGHLFQDPLKGTAPNMTIEENLALAYLRAGTAPHAIFSRISRKDKELFREKLALLNMGLEDRMKQPVGLLSGGQRQALTLLMATLVTPKLLLLDEHTAALDPATAEKVLELTKSIVAEKKITCLMVTHNMHQALELGNRTLMMDGGRIVFDVKGEERSKMTVDDLLEKFREKLSLLDMGLEDRMKQPVGLLSGGQRQALTLLMATLVTPKLLLLDEHTAALDPATAEKVLELTKSIVAEKKITCLMVTHNMHQALELGNRTLMMDAGRVVFDVQGEERSRMTVDDLLEKFRENAGKTLDNDRILLSKVEQ